MGCSIELGGPRYLDAPVHRFHRWLVESLGLRGRREVTGDLRRRHSGGILCIQLQSVLSEIGETRHDTGRPGCHAQNVAVRLVDHLVLLHHTTR